MSFMLEHRMPPNAFSEVGGLDLGEATEVGPLKRTAASGFLRGASRPCCHRYPAPRNPFYGEVAPSGTGARGLIIQRDHNCYQML